LLQSNRGHWGVEIGLHFRRDVTLHEDAGRASATWPKPGGISAHTLIERCACYSNGPGRLCESRANQQPDE
jgi:hypothetical protein